MKSPCNCVLRHALTPSIPLYYSLVYLAEACLRFFNLHIFGTLIMGAIGDLPLSPNLIIAKKASGFSKQRVILVNM